MPAFCPLSTAFCPLSTAFCPLSTAFCSLSSVVYCFLSVVYCFLSVLFLLSVRSLPAFRPFSFCFLSVLFLLSVRSLPALPSSFFQLLVFCQVLCAECFRVPSPRPSHYGHSERGRSSPKIHPSLLLLPHSPGRPREIIALVRGLQVWLFSPLYRSHIPTSSKGTG